MYAITGKKKKKTILQAPTSSETQKNAVDCLEVGVKWLPSNDGRDAFMQTKNDEKTVEIKMGVILIIIIISIPGPWL